MLGEHGGEAVMILIQFGCIQCDKDVTVELDGREPGEVVWDLLPNPWRIAWTSSSTAEVFCSEKCMRAVLP